MVKLLCNHDANVNDGGGWMLIAAVRYSDRYDSSHGNKGKAIVELLCKYGAKVNVKDERGNTALYFAISGKNREVVEVLCKHGAKVNEKNNYGETPLFVATRSNNSEITKVLKKYGAKLK